MPGDVVRSVPQVAGAARPVAEGVRGVAVVDLGCGARATHLAQLRARVCAGQLRAYTSVIIRATSARGLEIVAPAAVSREVL